MAMTRPSDAAVGVVVEAARKRLEVVRIIGITMHEYEDVWPIEAFVSTLADRLVAFIAAHTEAALKETEAWFEPMRAEIGKLEDQNADLRARLAAAEGAMAGLTDRVNTWLREVHRDSAQAREWTPQAIGVAVDELGYAHNHMQQERDALKVERDWALSRLEQLEVTIHARRWIGVEPAEGPVVMMSEAQYVTLTAERDRLQERLIEHKEEIASRDEGMRYLTAAVERARAQAEAIKTLTLNCSVHAAVDYILAALRAAP